MAAIFLILPTTIMMMSTFPSAGAGEPDVVADCRELSRRNNISQDQLGPFMNGCIALERQCYAVEKEAAASCGEHGPAEQSGRQASLNMAGAVGKGGPSFAKSGTAAQGHCSKVHQFRDSQTNRCAQLFAKCHSLSMNVPNGRPLDCGQFAPESLEWSAGGKSRPNICSAISHELGRIEKDTQASQSQCNELNNIVDNARQREGSNRLDNNKMDSPDARACGIFGCSKNPDGTYSKNGPPAVRREEPYRKPASDPQDHYQAQSGPSTPQREGPRSNQSIRLTVPDAIACGIYGCEENKDGSYSPKYAPNSVDPNDF